MLNGSTAGSNVSSGLHIAAGGSTVRGLVINDFGSAPRARGILLDTKGGNTIVGNLIGTDPSGEYRQGNTGYGVDVESSGNTIGGTSPADRNLISGNGVFGTSATTSSSTGFGVFLSSSATGNTIAGNFIGTDATGGRSLGNAAAGVYLGGATNNTIGGTVPGAGNVISGNFPSSGTRPRVPGSRSN